MTSASELFYTRRSRFGRSSNIDNLDPDFDSHPHRNFHSTHNRRHHGSHNQHRRDFDSLDPVRRSPRKFGHRVSFSEHDSVRFEQGPGRSVLSNPINTEALISESMPVFTRNERLPGSVLLARERLVERLRGASVSENRQSSRSSPGSNSLDNLFTSAIRLANAEWDLEILGGLSGQASHSTDPISQPERIPFLQERNKKPPGLTQQALDCLVLEIYSSMGIGVGAGMDPTSLRECSICLENFSEGDLLISLPCEHKFHSACLEPWVRTCGDCPYCRSCI